MLDGLNALALGAFKGNIWAGETKINLGFYCDEQADEKQRGFTNNLQWKGWRICGRSCKS